MVYLWHLFPLGLWKEDGWLFSLQAPVSFRFSLWTLKIQNNQIHFSRMVLKYNVCFFHKMLWKNPNKLNFLAKSIYQTITSLQIDGETMETVTDFIFFGSKITSDGDCSLEIKRCLLLGRKATTNLDSILKSRDITLPTRVRLVKAMVFPVVMYECESWTIKKAEPQRIDAFELWCWRRLLLSFGQQADPTGPS